MHVMARPHDAKSEHSTTVALFGRMTLHRTAEDNADAGLTLRSASAASSNMRRCMMVGGLKLPQDSSTTGLCSRPLQTSGHVIPAPL